MAGLNIRLNLNRRQGSSDKKQYLPYVPICFSPFRCRFAGPLQFSSSTVKHTKLYHSNFRDVFQFFTRKLFEKNCLLVECLPSNSLSEGAASCKRLKKAGILARNSHTSVASDWMYHFFTRAKHRSLFWLVKTHFCKKIYDIAFWWVYLGRYLKSVILYVRVCVHVWMGVVYYIDLKPLPQMESWLRLQMIHSLK